MNNNVILDLSSGWEFKKYNSDEFLSAIVPGCIHLDLLNHNLIPDPFFGENEKKLQWVSDNDWIYRLNFFVDEDFISKKNKKLIFHGIDTYASVYLNDSKIIEADNMFHPWESNVTNILKLGQNKIEIEFRSPLNEILPKLQNRDYVLPADNDKAGGMSPYIRKAPYHFGWDWGPCLITSGLWKKVELVGYDSMLIENINLSQITCNSKMAKLSIEVELLSKISTIATLFIKQDSLNIEIQFQLDILKGKNKFNNIIKIVNHELWWPSGHGEQHLYKFEIRIQSNDIDKIIQKRIGFRNVKIKREKDKAGESFEIYVNDKAIFSKGANWIPADSFTTRLKKEDYRRLLEDVVKVNMNTIRVWGGGIYESDFFYDICDELGILVWQDFMFACSLYPGDNEFLKSVEKEAIYQVKRLKDHSSIILWCGNNEIAWAWYNWEWKEKLPKHLWEDYKSLFHNVLTEVCKKYDPIRLYWPTSPGHGTDAPITGQLYGSGDNHYWGVWHGGDDFEAYEDNVGRFMSEYGMQSYPELQTVKTFTNPKDRDINSRVMISHQKASLGNKNVIKYIEKYNLKPNNFESLLIISQIMQAEAIKVAVESHRRNMPYCMGTLYWQLNDCWPGASWSSIDYRGTWKALHYAAKNFFKSVLVSIKIKNDKVEFYVINDLHKVVNCDLHIELYDFSGERLKYFVKPLKLNSISSKKYFSMSVKELIENKRKSELLLRSFIKKKEKIISKNSFYFVKPKEINIPKPKFNLEYEFLNKNTIIIITSYSFLYKVHINCVNSCGIFSENYIDLLPGEIKKIKFEINDDSKINNKELMFKVKTMYDLVY